MAPSSLLSISLVLGTRHKNSSSYGLLSPCQHFFAEIGKISILDATRRMPLSLLIHRIPHRIRTTTKILKKELYYVKLSFLCYFCKTKFNSISFKKGGTFKRDLYIFSHVFFYMAYTYSVNTDVVSVLKFRILVILQHL